jgi:hypothetical protein
MWPVHVAKTRPALHIPPTPFRVSRMQVWEFESPVNAGHDLSLPLDERLSSQKPWLG